MANSIASVTAIAERVLDFTSREAWREICRMLTQDYGFRIGRDMSDVATEVWSERKRLRRERQEARAAAKAAAA